MLTTVVGPHPKPVTIKSLVESLGISDVSVPWVIPICSQGWEALASSPNFLLKEEKTKTQKDKVTCLAMHRKVTAEPGPVFSSPSFAVCYSALRHARLCSTLGLVSLPLESQSGHPLQTLPQEAAICEWPSTHWKCSEHWANSAFRNLKEEMLSTSHQCLWIWGCCHLGRYIFQWWLLELQK